MPPQYIPLSKNMKDLSNQVIGRLTVLGAISQDKKGRLNWLCLCSCGNEIVVSSNNLRQGHTTSCGCYKMEQIKNANITHGMTHHPLRQTWNSMIQRCTNLNNKRFSNYGGRGISVCNQWRHDFKAFHDYVSQLPHCGEKGYSLDRINNNGNYEPGNVRWATRSEQANNTTNTRLLTYDGKTQRVIAWAEEIGISSKALNARLRRNWPLERALTARSFSR